MKTFMSDNDADAFPFVIVLLINNMCDCHLVSAHD